MATISATMVKDLRDKTGAGMMDCKAALAETKGDMEAAVDWLRTKGLAKAAKKAGRVAAEGLIGLAADAKQAALVEVNSETDFVARNAAFQKMASGIAEAALQAKGDLDKLSKAKFPGGSATVGRHHQGDGRLDRREHDASPRRISLRQGGRRRQLHAQRDCAWPRQDRRHRRARVERQPGGRQSLRPSGRHAYRFRQPAKPRCRQLGQDALSSASARC